MKLNLFGEAAHTKIVKYQLHTQLFNSKSLLKSTINHSNPHFFHSEEPSEIEYLYGQNFYQLRDECLEKDELFEDPEFPADNELLRKRSERYIDDVEWMRPHDIARPEDPILVSDRNEGFDIRTRQKYDSRH